MPNSEKKKLHDKKIYKTFGTVLRSNPIVDEESKQFETISNLLDIPIPKQFDGRKVWDKFISTPVRNQGPSCGNCWAHSTANMLADRFEIQTAGKIQFHSGLSTIQMTICEYESDINWTDLKDNETLQEQARAKGHSTSA